MVNQGEHGKITNHGWVKRSHDGKSYDRVLMVGEGKERPPYFILKNNYVG
jgi:hypothetical protein